MCIKLQLNLKDHDVLIGDGEKCFIVAEIGVNHNGSIDTAKKLIEMAKKSGADAVKFQTWKTENIILKDVDLADYQRAKTNTEETQFEMLKKLELSYDSYFELKKYADNIGIIFFSTMEDKESVDFLINEVGIPLIKVGSGDLSNYPLLKYTAKYNIPMVLSTGMSTLSEIDDAMKYVNRSNVILLQCTTQYPCLYENVNLKAMLTLKEVFKTVVGFSDHSLGIECTIASVALGASYVEKHFTLDKNMRGPDHAFSLEYKEFKEMVSKIRNVESALGNGIKTQMTSSDMDNIKKKIVAGQDIKKGDVFGENNILLKRSKCGLDAKYYNVIEGKISKKCINKDEAIFIDYCR